MCGAVGAIRLRAEALPELAATGAKHDHRATARAELLHPAIARLTRIEALGTHQTEQVETGLFRPLARLLQQGGCHEVVDGARERWRDTKQV